jgi:hypothetical protein
LIDKISKNRKYLPVFCRANSFNEKVCLVFSENYLKPTAACQTKANNKNITGIAGIMSTIGRKAV